MKTIVAGSRTITQMNLLNRAIEQAPFKITHIISGGALGVDRLGEIYAQQNNLPLTILKADWHTHGKSAGYKRNIQMAKEAEALIAVWDGQSKGTEHMIRIAHDLGLTVFVVNKDGTPNTNATKHPLDL